MKVLRSIRSLYTPIQPAVKIGRKDIIYKELQPTNALQPFVYCYWQLKTNQPLEAAYHYRVVSDGCIDVFFNLNAPEQSFAMGFCRKFTAFPIGKTFNWGGIRFLPSAFSLLFDISAYKLTNKDQPLVNVLPKLAESITETIDLEFVTNINRLDKILSPFIPKNNIKLDHRFYDALLLIFKNNGYIAIEDGLNTGLSPRQLRRIFNYHLGTSPKSFSQIVRFQYILNANPSLKTLKDDKLFYDVGFYDQAHFIKDFKKFYGVTPTEAFQ